MILSPVNIRNCITPVRTIKAKVELYNGSTLVDTYTYTDKLLSFSVDRAGEDSKFFGFAVCQKANIKLLDKERALDITTANHFKIYMATEGAEWVTPFPDMYVTEVHKDENKKTLSITVYDKFYAMNNHYTTELALQAPYTLQDFANACADLMGLTIAFKGLGGNNTALDLTYPTGANIEGTETIREMVQAIAEATQTICFISGTNLVFRRLSSVSTIAADTFIIDEEQQIELKTGDNRRLATICHATELGDNVSASLAVTGTTQYVRNNPFWGMRDDIDTIVENALATIGGLTIQELEIKWRGIFLIEIGDMFTCVAADGTTTNGCYILNDTITYNGSMSQKTKWQYKDDGETESNTSTLGEVLKQTYAKVDKANKQIDIIASESSANSEAIAGLTINTESIVASVTDISKQIADNAESVNNELETLTKRVNATMSADEIALNIETALENGAGKVVTTTGFTFDENGLKVEKTDSEMSTQITEDGMKVYKNNKAVLVADNTGVDAVNLRATTYLIVGSNSRFEDYGRNRTGCFWIGR